MDTSATLAAQGLDASDLEANEAGRVSEKQIARMRAVRRAGAMAVWIIAAFVFVACSGVGVKLLLEGQRVGAIVFGGIGLGMAALPLGIYYAFRFVDPAKVATCKVTQLKNAEVGGFLSSPNRGVYAIRLNGTRYSGFAKELGRRHLGARVNAHVVAEHRIVVALEPVD